MGRCWSRHWSRVPWWLPDSDLVEADDGKLGYTRDVRINGKPERQIAMHVVGQFSPVCVLGLLAVRCEWEGGRLVPMTCAIPDTVAVGVVTDPVFVSNPRRSPGDGADKERDR